MERFRLVWLLTLSLMVAGLLTAHGVAYRLVAPDGAERVRLLDASGHGYLSHSALLFGFLITVALIVLLGAVVAASRGRRLPRSPRWFYALVPPLGFIVLEHVERLFHSGLVPLGTALEPAFLVGLLLQLPFAAALLFLSRALLAAAAAIGSALAADRRSWATFPSAGTRAVDAELARISILALGRAERGPPPLAPR